MLHSSDSLFSTKFMFDGKSTRCLVLGGDITESLNYSTSGPIPWPMMRLLMMVKPVSMVNDANGGNVSLARIHLKTNVSRNNKTT